MHVRDITLENVRQFEHATFRFQPGFNLLVGENGSGKTTILRAIFSIFGPKQKASSSKSAFNNSDIKLEANQLKIHAMVTETPDIARSYYYVRKIGTRLRRSGTESGVVVLYYNSNEALGASLATGKNRRTFRKNQASPSGKLRLIQEDLYLAEQAVVSVAASEADDGFGDSDTTRNFVAGALAKMATGFRDFYWRFEAYACEIERLPGPKPNSKIESWRGSQMMVRLGELVLRAFQLNPELLAGFDKRAITVNSDGFIVGMEDREAVGARFEDLLKVNAFTSEIDRLGPLNSYVAHIRLSPNIIVHTIQGELPVSKMSDGEQRLFTLLVDVGRRISRKPHDAKESLAPIILIDEIDLHLHPKWQRLIVPVLEDLFPFCQFIATTHSPFVIQSLPMAKVQKVTSQGTRKFDDEAFSIEDIAEEIQGVEMPQRSKRAQEMEKASENYFRLLAADQVAPEELRAAEYEYRCASEPFASDPAVEALLRIAQIQSKKQ